MFSGVVSHPHLHGGMLKLPGPRDGTGKCGWFYFPVSAEFTLDVSDRTAHRGVGLLVLLGVGLLTVGLEGLSHIRSCEVLDALCRFLWEMTRHFRSKRRWLTQKEGISPLWWGWINVWLSSDRHVCMEARVPKYIVIPRLSGPFLPEQSPWCMINPLHFSRSG